MSNLFSSLDAFDFSQGLVFYHVKAAGCACFSGARRGGGGGRTASRGCQIRRAAGKAAGGKGRDAPASPPCLAVGGGRGRGAWPRLARTGALF